MSKPVFQVVPVVGLATEVKIGAKITQTGKGGKDFTFEIALVVPFTADDGSKCAVGFSATHLQKFLAAAQTEDADKIASRFGAKAPRRSAKPETDDAAEAA